METKTKRSTRENRDRISQLPDELLHHILSFLDTIYAVQMSVLSKRWVSLWRSLPFLHFSFDTLRELLDMKEEEEEDEALWTFGSFIVHVISQRYPTANLVRVCFNCSHDSMDPLVIHYLISYSVRHNVQNLQVCNSSTYLFPLHWVWLPNIYSSQSKSFTALTLIKYHCYCFRNSIHFSKKFLAFPALKSLDLTGFFLEDFKSDPNIFSSYPNLEILKLSNLQLDLGPETFRIHALNLKKLVISVLDEGRDFQDRCKLEIHAPKLTTFNYFGQFRIVCSTERLTSLDDVCFDVYSNHYHYEINKEEFPYVMNTLKEFDHVKSLTLSIETIEWILGEFDFTLHAASVGNQSWMTTGGVSNSPLDGDQGISVLRQKNDALQRWEQHNKQMDLQFRRFDELSDEIVDRLDNLIKIYAHRRQVDNRKPRVEMAHGDPIEKLVSVCRNPVDNRKPGVEIARGGPIERPEHIRRNPIYDKGFEENRQRQPFRIRCTINGKVFPMTIDNGCCKNIVSQKIVELLNLTVKKHPWEINGRCKILFSVGMYSCETYCNIVDMKHSKIILGKPWQFDEGAQYSYDDNVYKIRKEGKGYKLIPLPGKTQPKTFKIDGQIFLTKEDKEIQVTQRKDESMTCDTVAKDEVTQRKDDSEIIDKVTKDEESVESKTPDQYVTVEEKQKELVVEKKSEFPQLHVEEFMDFSVFMRVNNTNMLFAAVDKHEAETQVEEHSGLVQQFLQEFRGLRPDDIPDNLPLIHGICHFIDFIPEVSLSNFSHFRINLKEHEILMGKVKQKLEATTFSVAVVQTQGRV
ncbi:hypothetical protein CCACVL1_07561 [Corchorus capsularis]|uniref:F-box domain-containing protein n=1 Tax=Corchorus capsularis TaxID=210143 RepID=A0A1R3J533_COCAP|nr:hypothetical protein CCACVL1_07561 [Corchorus capsularis]